MAIRFVQYEYCEYFDNVVVCSRDGHYYSGAYHSADH